MSEINPPAVESDVVDQLVGGISPRVKLIVYFVGDTLLFGGIVIPMIYAFIASTDPTVQGALLGGMFSSAGGYLLTMFGIYKSNAK
jgi:hypothetical protein